MISRARYAGPILAPRPDEIFYSWVARLSACFGGLSRTEIGHLFFGGLAPSFYADLPTGLDRFVLASGQVEAGVLDLACRMSSFGYFANFLEPQRRTALLAAMANTGTYPPSCLGLEAKSVLIDRLRFCSECHRVMDERYAGRWWRRAHQLPTTLVCPDHGVVLRQGAIDAAMVGRGFHLPTDETCLQDSDPLLSLASEAARDKLLIVAQLGAFFLDRVFAANPSRWAKSYRAACRRSGFEFGSNEALRSALHGRLINFWMGVADDQLGCRDLMSQSWVHRLIHGNKQALPMHHLLLQTMLVWPRRGLPRFNRLGRNSAPFHD